MPGGPAALRASFLIALCTPVAARAGEIAPELALTWQAPEGCPSPTDVEVQFARLLGGPGRRPAAKRIAASIVVVRAPSSDGWVLELATLLGGATGRRSFTGDSCASVASAAALILALMIDPAAAERAVAAAERAVAAAERAVAGAERAVPAQTPPVPRPAVTAPATPSPPTLAAPPVETRKALRSYARAFAGVVGGLLPTPAPAAGVALGARRGRVGAELSILATGARRAAAADLAGAGGDFRLLAGGARGCGSLDRRVVVWQLCLGAELERLAGTGFGVQTPRSRSVTMLAGVGGLLVAVPLGSRLALSLDLAVALRPYHPAFVLDNVGPVFQIPLASGVAAAGLIITI